MKKVMVSRGAMGCESRRSEFEGSDGARVEIEEVQRTNWV